MGWPCSSCMVCSSSASVSVCPGGESLPIFPHCVCHLIFHWNKYIFCCRPVFKIIHDLRFVERGRESPVSRGCPPRALKLRSWSAGSLYKPRKKLSFKVYPSIALGSYPAYHWFGGLEKLLLAVCRGIFVSSRQTCHTQRKTNVNHIIIRIWVSQSIFVRTVAQRQQARGCIRHREYYCCVRTLPLIVRGQSSGNRSFLCAVLSGASGCPCHTRIPTKQIAVFSYVSWKKLTFVARTAVWQSEVATKLR